ncbi:Flagellin 2 [Halomonas sp. THAF5a]|uniref:FliC/FljB family flagellin n=1 Tax=Halomonas sp. THAF5a TaxID=2587844 RepID=UPI001267E682|nr:FliC/FljB family flagellin [Halomonas sp. THAF5a]QFU00147.1 Flagellin 2 [Halomonas sp. THAF5a]
MSVINTNITSMIGQQNLRESQNSLSTAMERLSSGLRINSAKDDAAGQAIANRMSAQITGLSQAQRNANDGISVAQTAEGALNQVNDNLQRVRELTVQAQNDTNSADDRASIQAEIDQRLTEIDRISEQTDFNGVKVLSSNQSLSIQVGANDGESIDVNLEKTTANTLGLGGFSVTGPVDKSGTAGAKDVFGEAAHGLVTLNKTSNAAVAGAAFKAAYGESTQVTDTKVNDFSAQLAKNLGVAASVVNVTASDAYVDDAGNWYAKVDIDSSKGTNTVQALNQQGLMTEDASGNKVQFDSTTNTTGTYYVAIDPADADNVAAATVNFSEDGKELGVKDLMGGATANPMEQLDTALNQVDELRSDLGAIQNRFESAITNLSTNETNLSAARSRIEDADYATEVANMTKNQILQQAGTSVLSQANQLPQNVLSLLG